MDPGLQPPLHLAGAPHLVCCICFQCRRLEFRALHGPIPRGDLENLTLLSQQSLQMLPFLPAKVRILQLFPLKLFHFVSTFEYSLGEKLEGDAPT